MYVLCHSQLINDITYISTLLIRCSLYWATWATKSDGRGIKVSRYLPEIGKEKVQA